MKLLKNLLPDKIETEDFYWDLYGEDSDMPNFWYKPTNLQIEWYNDDPGRAGFCNYEDSATLALDILNWTVESYVTNGGSKAQS